MSGSMLNDPFLPLKEPPLVDDLEVVDTALLRRRFGGGGVSRVSTTAFASEGRDPFDFRREERRREPFGCQDIWGF